MVPVGEKRQNASLSHERIAIRQRRSKLFGNRFTGPQGVLSSWPTYAKWVLANSRIPVQQPQAACCHVSNDRFLNNR
jgi:hypothetical protein